MVERHGQRQEGEDQGSQGIFQRTDVDVLEYGQEGGFV